MAAFADVGVDFVQDFLLGRSKTVNDLSDLLKERSVLRRQSRERLVWKMASEKRVVLADEVIG